MNDSYIEMLEAKLVKLEEENAALRANLEAASAYQTVLEDRILELGGEDDD